MGIQKDFLWNNKVGGNHNDSVCNRNISINQHAKGSQIKAKNLKNNIPDILYQISIKTFLL